MSIDGKWTLSINTPMGKQDGEVTFATDGEALSGSMTQMGNTVDVANGSYKDGAAAWEISISSPMPMTISFTGKVDGDSISGEAALGAFGNADFSGTRA